MIIFSFFDLVILGRCSSLSRSIKHQWFHWRGQSLFSKLSLGEEPRLGHVPREHGARQTAPGALRSAGQSRLHNRGGEAGGGRGGCGDRGGCSSSLKSITFYFIRYCSNVSVTLPQLQTLNFYSMNLLFIVSKLWSNNVMPKQWWTQCYNVFNDIKMNEFYKVWFTRKYIYTQ